MCRWPRPGASGTPWASATTSSATATRIAASRSRTTSASSPRIDNPEVAVKEHRTITISRAYWADDPDAHSTIKEAKWLYHDDGSRSLLIHGEEWFDDWSGPQYRPFLEAAGREFLFRAAGRPDVRGRTTTSSITWHSRGLHEIEVLIPARRVRQDGAGRRVHADAPQRGGRLQVEDQGPGDDRQEVRTRFITRRPLSPS